MNELTPLNLGTPRRHASATDPCRKKGERGREGINNRREGGIDKRKGVLQRRENGIESAERERRKNREWDFEREREREGERERGDCWGGGDSVLSRSICIQQNGGRI